jgi:guanylate kinase
MENEHVLFLIVGKSGSGKSRLINELCKRNNYRQLVSQTTRARRSDNDDHIFVSVDDYRNAKANGEIAAETEIAGNYYYATIDQLYNADFYTIDPNGIDSLLAMNLQNIRFVTIYVSCPYKLRETRAIDIRGDNRSTYRERCLSERSQFRRFISNELWDYSIVNIDFAKTYSVMKWICNVEGVWKNHVEDTTE